MRTIDAGEGTVRVVFDASGRFLATLGRRLNLWDLDSMSRVRLPPPALNEPDDIAFFPGALGFAVTMAGEGARLSVRGAPHWAERWGLAVPAHARFPYPLPVVVTPDASRVIVGAPDGFVYVWDAATGKLLLHFKAHADPPPRRRSLAYHYPHLDTWGVGGIGALAVDPRRQRLITAGQGLFDRNLRAWDVDTGAEITTFFPPGNGDDIVPPEGLKKIQMGPDGRMYALGMARCGMALWLWDVSGRSARLLAVIRKQPFGMTSFDIDPLGRYLATGHRDGTIAIRDIRDGTVVEQWRAHDASNLLTTVAWHPSGKWLASATLKHRFVKLWPIERRINCGR